MALDRQSIERRDFPIGQRGYDPDAVDAHLSALADELDEFKHQARRRSDAVASSASEQVRSIVEAAERSAVEIQQQAEADAREIRDEAAGDARATAERAHEEAREHVDRVSEAASAVLERLERLEHELTGLVEEFRAGRERFDADLGHLRVELAGVAESVASRSRFQPDAEPAAAEPPVEEPPVHVPADAGMGAPVEEPPVYVPPEPGAGAVVEEPPMYVPPEPGAVVEEPPMYVPPEPGAVVEEPPMYVPPEQSAQAEPAYAGDADADADHGDSAGYDSSAAQRITAGYGDTAMYGGGQEAASLAQSSEPEPGYETYAAQPAQETDDTEGARLIALNMALNGTPRGETERYLSENFQLTDARGLLDEVYASVDG